MNVSFSDTEGRINRFDDYMENKRNEERDENNVDDDGIFTGYLERNQMENVRGSQRSNSERSSESRRYSFTSSLTLCSNWDKSTINETNETWRARLYNNRRLFLMWTLMVEVGALLIVALIILFRKEHNASNDILSTYNTTTEAPSRTPIVMDSKAYAIQERIVTAINDKFGCNGVNNSDIESNLFTGYFDDDDSPQSKAFRWIILEDKLNLNASSENIVQRFALAHLFFATIATNSLDANIWLDGDSHECSWEVVSCPPVDEKVIKIDLNTKSLDGTIPREIALLDDLRTFDVATNYLHGPLPTEIGLLGNLEMLRVDLNYLTGLIPSELGNIVNLRTLILNENIFSGSIPNKLCSINHLVFDCTLKYDEPCSDCIVSDWPNFRHEDVP